MVGEAAKNAKARAQSMVSGTNAEIGVMNSAKMGVFQIVPENSTDVSDSGFNDTTSINKKTLISIQTKVYLTMKKILRQFALLTKIEIPNEHIFRLAISYNDYKEISNEITKALESVNEEMEDNKIYQQFIIEISDIFHDNNIHLVFINQKSFLEEYLSLLININKIYVELNYIHQSINILFESLPIFFALNNFDEVKKILIYLSKRKEIQQHKWIYIQDLIQIMIILLMKRVNIENLF
jgi:hypothetical protein